LFQLQVTRGPDKGKKIRLEAGKAYSVGCNDDAALVLSDPMVLKDHCTLQVDGDTVVLRNNTASAGTFVGDKKISQARLKPSSLFRVGDSLLAITPAPRGAAPRTPPSAPDPLLGKILGGYKLIEVVGEGGMGKVYRATQLSLHRDVALKVLRDALTNDQAFRDLFINEARAAAQLVHPNVVQVYDAGTEGAVAFFSMEFIGQGSVEEILAREGKIPWEQAILMILEAAHGLQYAEGKGIVHRDIKPDNLMINDDGRVKIADLGLAKRGEGARDKGIIGTPHFIPPEQALGQEVDSRADIYSLGATFYRMITGKTLFSGATAKEIVLKHIKEPAPAASSVEDSVPDDLDLVLAKMLAKDPGQRYANTTELIKALEEVCANHGIKGAIIRKGVGKRVLIPLILLLVAAGGVIYWYAVRPKETYIPPEVLEAQEKAQAEALKKAEEAKEAKRKERQATASKEALELDNGYWQLDRRNPLKSVFDEGDAERKKQEWLEKAKEFEDFAKSPLAIEFEGESQLVTNAEKRAQEIRTTLEKLEASANDKKEKTDAQVAEATKIDQALRKQLAELRAAHHYEAACNLCALAGTGKPEKSDPFKDIVSWTWVSPVDPDLQAGYSELPRLMKVVEDARKFFAAEREKVVQEAQTVWNVIRAENDDLAKNGAAKSDADYERVIEKLQGVCQAFPEQENRKPVEEIDKIVGEAGDALRARTGELANRRAARLAEDRVKVRNTLRRLSSLDPEQIPNSVMECDFPAAMDAWGRLLVDGDIKSERYKAFVRERIEMLRWCEYLFARFQADLRRETKGNEKVFTSLDVESVPFADRPLENVKLTDKAEGRYKFSISKSYKGDSEFSFGAFPMDWVYHGVLLFQNEPRWKDVPPVLEFALGAFCFETMQYKAAQHHFQKVLESQDPEVRARYAAWTQSLLKRAEKEQAARAEWEALCQAVANLQKSSDAEELKKRILAYPQAHEGTIFFLETMGQRDEPKADFYPESQPEGDFPSAPPPPKS